MSGAKTILTDLPNERWVGGVNCHQNSPKHRIAAAGTTCAALGRRLRRRNIYYMGRRGHGETRSCVIPFGRSASGRRSSIPLFRDLGEAISVGLTELEGRSLIRIVDIFCRADRPSLLRSETGHECDIYPMWQRYRIYGAAVAIKLVRCSRYVSQEIRIRCSPLQIFVVGTAPYSHSGLAVEEKNNALKHYTRDSPQTQESCGTHRASVGAIADIAFARGCVFAE